MKKISLMALLIISCNSFAMENTPREYELAAKNVLDQRMTALGLEYFNEKTGLTETLACQKKTVKHLQEVMALTKEEYAGILTEMGFSSSVVGTRIAHIKNREPEILSTLLQEHPQALEELDALLNSNS